MYNAAKDLLFRTPKVFGIEILECFHPGAFYQCELFYRRISRARAKLPLHQSRRVQAAASDPA